MVREPFIDPALATRRQRSAKSSDMKLISHRYGKTRVRVLKVVRHGERHELKEADVNVTLEGDFESSYTRGDNSLVVPTDTLKNMVYALAKEKLGDEIEPFGLALGQILLDRYPQVTQATVRLSEQRWERMAVDSQPHAHSFLGNGPSRPFAVAVCSRGAASVESGVEELPLLKSAGSGFAGYVKDEMTTLAETRNRILATTLTAGWHFGRTPANYAQPNRAALEAMLKVFATRYSPSVQTTVFEMAQAALEAVPELDRVRLAMPNKHCLLVNLAPFDLENANEIFVPTDEPHGHIEATVSRA
jgi:urate oxidase